MRNRALRGCLIVLSLIICEPMLARSNNPAPSPSEIRKPEQPKSAETEKPTETDQNRTQNPSLSIKNTPTQKAQKEPSENANGAKDKAYSDWWMVWLTGILALIGFLQLIVFGLQARRLRQTIVAMKELGKEQREIGEAQVRAYVNISSVNMDFFGPEISPRINIVAFNSGQSPARNFIWSATLKYLPTDPLTETRNGVSNPNWSWSEGFDIPSNSPFHSAHFVISNMSIKQIIAESIPKMPVHLRTEFKFKSVFEKEWVDEVLPRVHR